MVVTRRSGALVLACVHVLSCLLAAGCSSDGDEALNALEEYASALGRSETEACARVWYGKVSPARCSDLRAWLGTHAPSFAGGKLRAESASVYGHGAGVDLVVRVMGSSGEARLRAHLLRSCDAREHRPAPRCPFWVESFEQAPPAP